MRKFNLLFLALLFNVSSIYAEDSEPDTSIIENELVEYFQLKDSVDNALHFETGKITLGDNLATINVPIGFKYLNSEQSEYVMTDLWGNPPSPCLGMLFPDTISPMDIDFTYAIEITFVEEGYIEDDDADDIDYDDLLEEMKEDLIEENKERRNQGYSTFELVGWASPPFYDSEEKKLHWAKELKFEGDETNTLNYNIRILGRKGVLQLNVISEMEYLPLVQSTISPILASVNFKSGNRYSDFDPDLDEVAAYGIGGLIAGKVLAKAGFFAVLLKFWKFIMVGLVAAFAGVKRFFLGKKKEEPIEKNDF